MEGRGGARRVDAGYPPAGAAPVRLLVEAEASPAFLRRARVWAQACTAGRGGGADTRGESQWRRKGGGGRQQLGLVSSSRNISSKKAQTGCVRARVRSDRLGPLCALAWAESGRKTDVSSSRRATVCLHYLRIGLMEKQVGGLTLAPHPAAADETSAAAPGQEFTSELRGVYLRRNPAASPVSSSFAFPAGGRETPSLAVRTAPQETPSCCSQPSEV